MGHFILPTPKTRARVSYMGTEENEGGAACGGGTAGRSPSPARRMDQTLGEGALPYGRGRSGETQMGTPGKLGGPFDAAKGASPSPAPPPPAPPPPKSATWYQKLAPSSCPGQVYSVCIREADSLMVLMSDVITLAI
ncbi:unnamed protein product [Gadus morhua 'NCC']